MHPYTLSFLFVFLPLSVFVFYLVRPRYRTPTLFLISCLFLATLSLWWLLLMLASVGFDYFFSTSIFVSGKSSKKGKILLLLCLVKNLGVFIVCSSLNQLGSIAMPVGVLVYSFTSIGYLTDLYNGETQPAASFWEFGLFCCFFGKLYVGPIISYDFFAKGMREFRPSMTRISQGIIWLFHGLAKKVVLADNVMLLTEGLRSIPYEEKSVVSVWLLVICSLFSIYYTLSGYSDIARGLGAIFGLELPANFHYPLQAISVTDFFSRFNVSANRFVRKYVYQALGAEDNGTLATTLNIFLITMLMGLWYGISLPYLFWGVFLGAFIVLETIFEERFFVKLHPVLRHLYTLAAILLSFSWYSSSSLYQAWFYLQTMLGFRSAPLLAKLFANGVTVPLFNDQLLHLLTSNWLLLAGCAIFCTSSISFLGHKFQQKTKRFGEVASLLSNSCLILLVLSFLV